MPALDSALRRNLENTIISARDAAERAAEAAIKALAVGQREPYASLTHDERRLRNRLRAKARQLGGGSLEAGLGPLVVECAYEQWHRMLFARFLAENNLLMHPEGVPVTLEECAELAHEEGDPDAWATAARYASLMLPGIFGREEPTLEVRLAPEGRRALERLLQEIPPPTFTADDGLGWVYQFWQTKAKEEVNASGRKIGGTDLPAVTQLFTEDYMVKFLLHNTLGAWWAARHPDSPINADLDYLRRLDDGTPAAGTFPGWPETVAELKVMDPCCGSGHFLTAAANLLARMRSEEDGLYEAAAFEAVLSDNLYGLEIDARCTQIAAFSLVLQAWKVGGYRELPVPNVACSGIPAGGREEEWTRLARGDYRLEETLRRLHTLFRNASDLGSLIDLSRVSQDLTLEVDDFENAEPLFEKALKRERVQEDPTAAIFGEAARGLVRAASLLQGRYHLVITNVPYLTRQKQSDVLLSYLEDKHPRGKADLATAFLERCHNFCSQGGSYALLTPQNWLSSVRYTRLREHLLSTQTWNFVARLGAKAFQTPMWDFNVMLATLTNAMPTADHMMCGIDISKFKTPLDKVYGLREAEIGLFEQRDQLKNPEARLVLSDISPGDPLKYSATALLGCSAGDSLRFVRSFWEVPRITELWEFHQSTVAENCHYGGRREIIFWEQERGQMYSLAQSVRHLNHAAQNWLRGKPTDPITDI